MPRGSSPMSQLKTALAILACATALGSIPGTALTFQFVPIAGDSLTPAQAAAFAEAGRAWSQRLADDVTVTVAIGFRPLTDNALGRTTPVFVAGNAAQITQRFTQDATTPTDRQALAALASAPLLGRLALTNAQAKALGYRQTGLDGTIEFSSTVRFIDQRNPNGTIPPDAWDLVGVAEHEIAHLLGFDSGLDGDTQGLPTLLDAFRWRRPGVRATTPGPATFSLDGGATALAAFSPGGPGNEEAGHWATGTGALMDPSAGLGQVVNIGSLDVQALDATGWDATTTASASLNVVAAAVPAPSAWLVVAAGVAALIVNRRQ